MTTLMEKPMATKQEEALKILKGASGDDTVEVTHLEGGVTVIKVIPRKKAKENTPEQKKWAQVAEELAKENLLGNGLGDTLREHIGRSQESAHTAEERNRLINEAEKAFAGRGDEDSEAWIRIIKDSRTFAKAKTYDFS
jgi:hypothetical protein